MAANPKAERRRVRCVINGKEIDVWEGYRLWDAALDAEARKRDDGDVGASPRSDDDAFGGLS